MFWPVMFEAASNVGPEGPLKKMPILVLEIPGHTASSHAHTAKKKKTCLHGSCASFSHTVVETQVSSKKGLCVQQREVNDAAMVLHSVYKARMFM